MFEHIEGYLFSYRDRYTFDVCKKLVYDEGEICYDIPIRIAKFFDSIVDTGKFDSEQNKFDFINTDVSCEECNEDESGIYIICKFGHTEYIYCADCIEKIHYCKDCNKLFCSDYPTVIDDEYICDDCSENYYSCEQCGEILHGEDTVCVDDSIYCSDCAERLYYRCDDCGDYFDDTEVFRHDDTCICNSCFERYDYSICDDCGEILNSDDVNWTDDGTYCNDCYEQHEQSCHIHNYSYKPSPEFFGDDSIFFGIELEIDKGNKTEFADEFDYDCAYLKEDGSLSSNGVEIVSHPLSYQYAMEEFDIDGICALALKHEFRSHDTDTCGIHVHVSRRPLTDKTIGNIIEFMEYNWQDIVKFTRRNSDSLTRWANRYGKDIIEDTPEETYHLANQTASRYRALNLQNSNTIEFRIFRGTLKVDTIKAIIQFCNNLVHYCQNINCVKETKFRDIVEFGNQAELVSFCENKGLLA